jgi:hypothetical protein
MSARPTGRPLHHPADREPSATAGQRGRRALGHTGEGSGRESTLQLGPIGRTPDHEVAVSASRLPAVLALDAGGHAYVLGLPRVRLVLLVGRDSCMNRDPHRASSSVMVRFLGSRRLAYRLLLYSSTHCLPLRQLPSEARIAFSRPRRAALRRAITLRSFVRSASRGTSFAGPATAGRTKRVRLSRTARAISSPKGPASPRSALVSASRYRCLCRFWMITGA